MPKLTQNSAMTLTISGIDMNGPAWKVLNMHVLKQPPPQRGSDRLIPGSSGVLAYRRRTTVAVHSLQMLISGTHDRNGASNNNRVQQLFTNIDYLGYQVVEPPGSGNGTRAAVLTTSGEAAALTADIHVLGLELGEMSADASWMKAVLEISIPAGRFD
jgi:hypothetical protein